jgi:hypothetical protein
MLGECFLEMKEVKELPLFMGEQIKNAKSCRQALTILKQTNHESNQREKIRRQKQRNYIGNDRPMYGRK